MNIQESYKREISKKLFMIRKYFRISQQQIADYVGVCASTYSSWENGKTSPDIFSFKMIVFDYWHIWMDDFLNEHISADYLINTLQNKGCVFPPVKEQKKNCYNIEKAKTVIKNRLPLLQKMSGISKRVLIERLNISIATYYSWEAGKSLPDIIMLKTIVTDILHYSLDDFLNESYPIEKLIPLQNDVSSREKTLGMLIKKKLPKLRKEVNISPDEMATYLGVDKQLYLSWEQGERLIDVLSLKKIVVDVLHITLEDFLNDEIPAETISSQLGNGLKPFLLNPQEQSFMMLYYRR